MATDYTDYTDFFTTKKSYASDSTCNSIRDDAEADGRGKIF